MRYVLFVLVVAVAALLIDSGISRAHYPKQTKAKGSTALERKHHRLHVLVGWDAHMKKHGRTYREVVFHRRWYRRHWAELVQVHAELEARASVRRYMTAAWAWYRSASTQCIVSHEGGWTTTSNPPYAGRFQMDPTFESTYGRAYQTTWGRASNWPPWAQVSAAYRAFIARGWGPWPTRQYCGL